MGNTKSELDLLKQENARLLTRIAELEQIAKEKNKLERRIVELERSAKENEERFAKLEQRQLQDDARSAVFPTLKSLVNTVPTEIVNSNDIPASEIIITSDTSNSDDTSEPNNVSVSDVSNNVSNSDEPNNVSASDISDNTLNSDVCLEEMKSRVSDIPLTQCFASPIPAETISLEEKEENEFLNLQYKDQVSKEITERIREKKLQDQEKIITSQDTKSSLSVKGGQGLIQELFTPELSLQESNIIQNHVIEISETGGPGKSNIDEASQHLAQL
ncbi:3522_t:CDS:1, partial [Entrophospora sp. SA101]